MRIRNVEYLKPNAKLDEEEEKSEEKKGLLMDFL